MYIYLIRLREFYTQNIDIYKVGKTSRNFIDRFKEYPKGSELLFTLRVNEIDILERLIIDKLKERFIHKTEYGNEYFEGRHNLMIDTIWSIVIERKSIVPTTLLPLTLGTPTINATNIAPTKHQEDVLDKILGNSNPHTTDNKNTSSCSNCSAVVDGVLVPLYSCGVGKLMVTESECVPCKCTLPKNVVDLPK